MKIKTLIIVCSTTLLIGCGQNQNRIGGDKIKEPAGANTSEREGAQSLGGFKGDADSLNRTRSNATASATDAGQVPGGANAKVRADPDAPLGK